MAHETLISQDDLLWDFAALLRSPNPPTLAHFVAKYKEIAVDDLAELVIIDQSARWAKGDRILVEQYLDQFPQFTWHDEELVSLLGYEYELRHFYGESPRPEQYYERFPALHSLLQEHFCVCHALAGSQVSDPRDDRVPPGVPAKLRLIALHAEGGLGRVWRAYDRELHREVVVKEMRPELANRANIRARFLREARVTGQLEHPNIIPVYELIDGSKDAQPCYAMRFVRGHTLSEAVRAQFEQRQPKSTDPMSRLRLLNAFISVCNAVAYAHSRGIVHRDLKPENIVLGRFGEVFVADWGLAKITGSADLDSSTIAFEQSAPENTIPGSVMGTPAYMAPEQAEGHSGSIDARTDIYGLGAILYVILTGKPPHEGASRSELLDRVSNNDPVRPHSLNPSVTLALEAICLKAMARSPDHRYKSATEIAQDVQRWMVGQPVEAYPEPFLARIRRWTPHYRAIAFVGCFVALAFGVASFAARPNRAVLEKLRLIQTRQDSDDRFARFQALTADAYYYGLPGPVGDLVRAERASDEALALYGVRTAEQCKGARDPDLDPTLSAQLPQELARLFVLRIYLREQSRERSEPKSKSDLTLLRLQDVGLASQAFQDYFRAEEHRTKDELEEAIRCYQRVLGAEPQNYWALTGLGHCYLRTGQAELARLAYQTCITLQPRSPWPWMQRGVAAAMADDADQAQADFQQALGIDHEFHPARFNLGLLYASRGQNELAVEQFDQILDKAQDPDVLNARAKCWMASGDSAKALDDVELAIRLRPDFAPALVSRARISVQDPTADRSSTLRAALQDLDQALEHAPKLVEAHLERAKVMESMGNVAEAVQSLGRALDIVRFDAAILSERARLFMAQRDFSAAQADCDRLLQVMPADPVAQALRARIQRVQSN